MKGKSKSSHDLLDDERLSSVPAVDTRKRKHDDDEDDAARVTTFIWVEDRIHVYLAYRFWQILCNLWLLIVLKSLLCCRLTGRIEREAER